MTQYLELCSFSVQHEYYSNNKPPITMSVTGESRGILTSGNCLFKSTGNTARILCEVPNRKGIGVDSYSALQALAEHQPDAVIEIHLKNEDSNHFNYTAAVFDGTSDKGSADFGPLTPDQIANQISSVKLSVSPSEARVIPKVRILGDKNEKTFDPEKADQTFATPVFEFHRGKDSGQADSSLEFWNSHAQAVARPLCVLQLPVTEMYRHLTELSGPLEERNESPRPIAIITTFASKKVYWRYNLMSFKHEMTSSDELSANEDKAVNGELRNHLNIVDRSGGIDFIRLPKEDIHGAVPARFVSKQAIPLNEQPTQQIELRGQVRKGSRIRDVRELLPVASAQNVAKYNSPDKDFESVSQTNQSTMFVADIFVN